MVVVDGQPDHQAEQCQGEKAKGDSSEKSGFSKLSTSLKRVEALLLNGRSRVQVKGFGKSLLLVGVSHRTLQAVHTLCCRSRKLIVTEIRDSSLWPAHAIKRHVSGPQKSRIPINTR